MERAMRSILFLEVMQNAMRKLIFGVIGLAGVCLSTTASAQNSGFDFTPYNIAVKVGVGLPLDSALADYGSPLIALGVEYTLNGTTNSSGATYISLDYLTASTEFNKGVFPLCINERFYFNSGKEGPRTYGFLGVGGAVVNVNSANTVIAGRAGLGADLGPNTFFETALLITDRAYGATGDSVTLYLGYRF
jgi:hypothetical protein